MRKIDIYGDITEEAGVIMVFTKIHEVLGFSKLVTSSARGFDIDSIEYRNNDVTVEFEYKSSNYILHGHQENMEEGRKYVVVCWTDDCGLATKLKEKYNKELYDIIEVHKYVNVLHNFKNNKSNDEPLYAILSYNYSMADNKDFGAWKYVNCFRTATSSKHPKFAGDKLPTGSKILFYNNGYIIGGFTVVRYEVIDKPKTEGEWVLYKKLTDYPSTLYTVSINWWKTNGFPRGHIFYVDFFDIRDFKIKLSNFIDKKMGRQGKINLSKEEYYSIMGH